MLFQFCRGPRFFEDAERAGRPLSATTEDHATAMRTMVDEDESMTMVHTEEVVISAVADSS